MRKMIRMMDSSRPARSISCAGRRGATAESFSARGGGGARSFLPAVRAGPRPVRVFRQSAYPAGTLQSAPRGIPGRLYLMKHDVLVREHHVGEHVLTHLIGRPGRLRLARPPGLRDRVMPVIMSYILLYSRLNRDQTADQTATKAISITQSKCLSIPIPPTRGN